jgi:hypothetical protein
MKVQRWQGSVPPDPAPLRSARVVEHPRSSGPPVSTAICGKSPSDRDLGRRSIPSGTVFVAQLAGMST